MKTLKQAKVKNFQSVADVTVDFGKFTVMVGPSNSGKSAFLRGVRACVRNSFVPANVRQGTSKSEVDLLFDDGTQVSIERGKSLSTYKMNSGASVFTKSARNVPEEVEASLKFPLIKDIDSSFSFQFDKPFLLAESGSIAAGVLGSLTNVSKLHEAVRESNRRRQEAASVLKVREKDVERLQSDLEFFRDLPVVKRKLEDVLEEFSDIKEKQEFLVALTTATDVVEYTKSSVDSLDANPPTDKSENISHLRELNADFDRLTLVADKLDKLSSSLDVLSVELNKIKDELDLTKVSYHERLIELKVCPVCNQEVAS